MANGTINLVNNSTALTGAGSKFLTEVTPGDFIYVEVGTVPYTLPVDKVNSDTSITLLRKFTGPTINGIAWTLIPRRAQNSVASALADQVAEAIRLSLNNENNWQKLLTENGNVTITRPDGSSYTGPSWLYLASSLANKPNTTDVGLSTAGNIQSADANDIMYNGFFAGAGVGGLNFFNTYGPGMVMRRVNDVYQVQWDGEGRSYARTYMNGTWSNWVPSLLRGDYGIGRDSSTASPLGGLSNAVFSGLYTCRGAGTGNITAGIPSDTGNSIYGMAIATVYSNASAAILFSRDDLRVGNVNPISSGSSTWKQVPVIGATATVDSSGYLKKASPIVKIFSTGSYELNDESEGVTVTRLDVGQYLIEGCEALNSDAAWGGWDGGFDIPEDRNKQPLIWLDYDVNPDGSVLVKTYHRTHPDSPEFARNRIGYKNDAGDFIETVANGDPVDIPSDQFVSVRVEMPQDSIWNQRQKEIAEMMDAETSNQESTTGDEVEKG